jgi:hypothetical protein
MATPAQPLYQQYYNPTYTGSQVGYSATTNPVQAAQNQRAVTQSQANEFEGTDEALANEYAAQQSGTQQYLNPIAQSQAAGQGGYTPGEASQIELTPQQESNIVTAAGNSAGVNTAAGVNAAERQFAATGGNPEALATYRARAAQQQGAQAGAAETGASVAAQQAGSAGAQAVGNAQLAEQNVGENYLGNLQASQGQQAQSEQGLAQGAFGTQVSGTGQATGQQIQAAQLPTTTDKIIGTVAGAASALADGRYYDYEGQDAVVGEDGPEAIVKAASDPDRSHTKFMADGDLASDSGGGPAGDPYSLLGERMEADGYYRPMMADGDPLPPSGVTPPGMSPGDMAPSIASPSPWSAAGDALKNYLQNSGKAPTQPNQQQPQQQWNKATPYSQAGSAAAKILANVFKPSAAPPTTGAPPAGGPWGNTPGAWNSGGWNSGAGDVTPDVAGGAADVAGGAADVPDVFGADGYYPRQHMADGRGMGPFHFSEPRQRFDQLKAPRGGYQPLLNHPKPVLADGYRARPRMLADGDDGTGPMDPAEPMPQAPQFNPGAQMRPAQIITKPTRVRLGPHDMVVPLTHRPKAKVRPSAMLAGGYRG